MLPTCTTCACACIMLLRASTDLRQGPALPAQPTPRHTLQNLSLALRPSPQRVPPGPATPPPPPRPQTHEHARVRERTHRVTRAYENAPIAVAATFVCHHCSCELLRSAIPQCKLSATSVQACKVFDALGELLNTHPEPRHHLLHLRARELEVGLLFERG